jgi:hypothetical protein
MFKKIDTGSEDFAILEDAAKKAIASRREGQIDYAELADAYNELNVGEYLAWPRSSKTLPVVKAKLLTLGLAATDFVLFPAKDDDADQAVLKRLTDAEMSKPTPAPRGRKPNAE